jgi:starvation-inducible DNA-binding protein
MNRSPSSLAADARTAVARTLQERLADAIDLHGQVKVAHWNVKGIDFHAYHLLFDTFATDLYGFVDAIAERAVVLGAHVQGTVRHAAAHSRLPEYGADTRRVADHVKLLTDRFELFLAECRTSRDLAQHYGDAETVDLLTQINRKLEAHAGYLRAALEGP